MIINESKYKYASDLKIQDLILISEQPSVITDMVEQKSNKNSYRIWVVSEELFSNKLIDKILQSTDKIEIIDITTSEWEVLEILNNGYVNLLSVIDNQIIRDDIPLPTDDENLFYKIKRAKLKFPNKKLLVDVISYKNLNKITAIKIPVS